MTKFIRSLVVLSFLFIAFNCAVAQDEKQGFDPVQLEEIRGESAYQYELIKPEPEGFLTRLWNRFVNWFQGLFSSKETRSAFDLIFKLVFAAAFIYFLIKALGGDVTGLFKSSSKPQSLAYEVDEEAIHEIDFEKEISQALNAQNYRLVVRLYYLQALKQASDAQWVSLMQGKTNYEYLYELKGAPIEMEFKRLSYLFDYTWYGHFEANEQLVKKAKELVNHILEKRGGKIHG